MHVVLNACLCHWGGGWVGERVRCPKSVQARTSSTRLEGPPGPARQAHYPHVSPTPLSPRPLARRQRLSNDTHTHSLSRASPGRVLTNTSHRQTCTSLSSHPMLHSTLTCMSPTRAHITAADTCTVQLGEIGGSGCRCGCIGAKGKGGEGGGCGGRRYRRGRQQLRRNCRGAGGHRRRRRQTQLKRVRREGPR
jgi:hypothetical protein